MNKKKNILKARRLLALVIISGVSMVLGNFLPLWACIALLWCIFVGVVYFYDEAATVDTIDTDTTDTINTDARV